MSIVVEPLQKSHNRKGFDCGEEALNRFLSNSARKAQERHISKTYVLYRESEPDTLLGYMTLASCTLITPPVHPLYRNYPHPLHATKLARLAVSTSHQGLGLGARLLIHAIVETVAADQHVPTIGLTVDPKYDRIIPFYARYGFLNVDAAPRSLMVGIDDILDGDGAIKPSTKTLWLPINECRALVDVTQTPGHS